MPLGLQGRIKLLMAEQASEAALPVSYTLLRGRSEEQPDAPDEQEESTPTPSGELPAPEASEAPDDTELPPIEFADADEIEPPDVDRTESQEDMELPADEQEEVEPIDVPEKESEPERPEPEWEEMLTQFEEPEQVDGSVDPYADAMQDIDWRMTLQNRSQSLL